MANAKIRISAGNLLMICIAITVLLVGISVVYEVFVSIPQHQKQQQIALQLCLSNAETDFNNNWTNSCKKDGVDNKGADCSLPTTIANTIYDYRTQEKADCFKQYPQK